MNKLYNYMAKDRYNEKQNLYRYVPIDQYSLKSLNMGELFLNDISNMNDVHEMEPYFNINANQDTVEQVISFGSEIYINEETKNYFNNLNVIMLNISKQDSQDWVKRYFDNCEDYDFEKYLSLYNDIMDVFKKGVKITSMSENSSSNVMWGNYASNHEGIMLEYDIEEIKKSCHNDVHIQKVNYVVSKHNATCFFHAFMYCLITLNDEEIEENQKYMHQMQRTNEILNFIFTKSFEWSYEHEVRLTTVWSNNSPILNVKPKSVTLGIQINSVNREHIIHICKQNGIDIYEAYKDIKSKSLEIPRRKINL